MKHNKLEGAILEALKAIREDKMARAIVKDMGYFVQVAGWLDPTMSDYVLTITADQALDTELDLSELANHISRNREDYQAENPINTIVTNEHGLQFQFGTAYNLMDWELLEQIESDTPQEVFDAYCILHEEKFGEEFVTGRKG